MGAHLFHGGARGSEREIDDMPDYKEKNGGKSQENEGGNNTMKGLGLWLILAMGFLLFLVYITQKNKEDNRIPFSPDFIKLVEDGKVSKCELVRTPNTEYIAGELTELDENSKPREFKTDVVIGEDLMKWIREKNIHLKVVTKDNTFGQFMMQLVPLLVVVVIIVFVFRNYLHNMNRGAMSFGKSRAKLLNKDHNRVTFEDVAGIDEARDEVQEIVEFLKDPKKFQKLGGRIPKGVLLVGPPGTGKTLLAKAISGEAQVPFFSISGSDFVEMFVGVGASRVRDMFEQGKKHAPCIIFIDEIDAVGRSRFSGYGGGHDEREQTLNAMLVEMDGFDTTEGVIILAATNRPDVLDNALLRPGRFDRQIYIDLPPLEGRLAIIKIHARKVKLSKDIELCRIARGTPGFSGADLENLINEAALIAARRNANAVGTADLEEARDKVRWGRERRSRVMDEKEKKLTAYHEAGHAVVFYMVEESDPLHKVSIIPRGAALGMTMQLPEKDHYTYSRKKLLGMISGTMGGRVAEEVVFIDVTTGAQNDFKQATHIARSMVCEWGMSSTIGPQSIGNRDELLFLGREVNRSFKYSEETARQIDHEVSQILNECYEQARRILTEHRDKLDKITEILLDKETIDAQAIEEVMTHGRLLSDEERDAAKKQKGDSESGEAEANEACAADKDDDDKGIGSKKMEQGAGCVAQSEIDDPQSADEATVEKKPDQA